MGGAHDQGPAQQMNLDNTNKPTMKIINLQKD
jgi:hypothetical protein